nr:DEAD/DEAH box helicase family protein [Kineococcus vitellinus]
MARAVHGADVLQYFKATLDAKDLNPPGKWAGLSPARRFVSDLGFPAEYAGTPADRRPAVFEVEGPSVIGELHDYQRIVAAGIKRLLGGEGPARGMVSLPTGAGKTRVAVQAFIEEVAEGRLQGPLLWIAQSDELCEQAVQTWAYVWRAVGPSSRLTLNRFWSDNDVVEDPSAFQVVVATDAKVLQAVKKNEHEWLAEAQVVVVDEAHTSISPTYTQILEWAGRGRSRAMRRPLIGLTATPFRNVNELETQRLINRYDGNRLDEGAFQSPEQAYSELQRRGMLASVKQRELAGVDVAMSQSEMASIDQFLRLPAEVEERLGEDLERNRRIVDDIVALPKDWPVLLFASSIENARALAALLTLEGVRSVAISAETDTAVRRRSVAGFQSGDIRVITNYNVLAQGFDAPAVRAVYVTRPTFSTNLYQQMIGRGLRGPKNGGSDEVLIVNVRDNLQQYGQKLAFYDFEYLWSRK